MAQHATIHGKNTTPVNGASGSWIPILVNSLGQLVTALLSGEIQAVNSIRAGAYNNYQQITTATTTVVAAPAGSLISGVEVVTGVAGTVTVYDNTAASGVKLIDAATTATSKTWYPVGTGQGVFVTVGITVVTSSTATVNVYYTPAT